MKPEEFNDFLNANNRRFFTETTRASFDGKKVTWHTMDEAKDFDNPNKRCQINGKPYTCTTVVFEEFKNEKQ